MTKKQCDKYLENMERWYGDEEKALQIIPTIQSQLYVICGMGRLGEIGAMYPHDFHIDMRLRLLPYKKTDIRSIARILARLAEIAGLEEPLEFDTYDHIRLRKDDSIF